MLETNHSAGAEELMRLEAFLNSEFAANEMTISKGKSAGIKFNTTHGADYEPYVEIDAEAMTDAEYEAELKKLDGLNSQLTSGKSKPESTGPEF